MLRDTLPSRLREFRKAANLTTAEVGKKIGKSDRTISAWENGRGQPDADLLLKLCEIYGIKSLSELVGEDSPFPVLSPDELRLLSLYREMNKQGRDYLLQTADMVSQIYKKFSNIPNVEDVG